MASELITVLDINEGEDLSRLVEQFVYLKDENESDFYIRSLEYPGLSVKLDRLLLMVAILKQGGYIKNESPDFDDDQNTYNSVFYYNLNQKFNVRTSEALQARWHRSKAGHWSYVIT